MPRPSQRFPLRVEPTLHIHPGREPVSFATFCREYPSRSIASDGYCPELTCQHFVEGGSWLNVNHHGEQAQILLRTSSEQIHDVVIKDGYFFRFVDRQIFCPQVFMNHPDEDNSLVWWIIENALRVREERLPRLETLLWMEGRMDATAGTYKFPPGYEVKARRLNWVFEDYRKFKVSGGLKRKDPQEYRAVVQAVGRRITAHVVEGDKSELPFDTRYKLLYTGPCWKLIEEVGLHARRDIFDSTPGFISVQYMGDHRYKYIFGSREPWGPFKARELGRFMNEFEGCTGDTWGGNDLIWGSPLGSHSPTPPDVVHELACKFHRGCIAA